MKKKILIIFGGTSSEHEVSCKSAANIAEKIDKEKYEVLMLGITKSGEWILTGASKQKIREGKWMKGVAVKKAIISPEKTVGGIIVDGKETIKIDCAFPIIHGKTGEDGALQGLLDLAGIAYVGAGVLGSACCMDKAITKLVADRAGVKQAKYFVTSRNELIETSGRVLKDIENHLEKKYPFFVKPANAGSSVGISKVYDFQELFEGIKKAAEEDHKVIVEESIVGRELEIAILGNRKPIASSIGEVVAVNDFYDYEAKYVSEAVQTKVPKDISDASTEKIIQNAIDIYKAIDCRGLARVDFFLTDKGEVIFNEINTLPGFTNISLYPKLWENDGITNTDLIDRLIELAWEYYEEDND